MKTRPAFCALATISVATTLGFGPPVGAPGVTFAPGGRTPTSRHRDGKISHPTPPLAFHDVIVAIP